MKIKATTLLCLFILSFFNVAIVLGEDSTSAANEPILKSFKAKSITSLAGSEIHELVVGKKYKLLTDGERKSKKPLFAFINSIRVDTLKPVLSQGYYFMVGEFDLDTEDKLTDILVEDIKDGDTVALRIGTSLKSADIIYFEKVKLDFVETKDKAANYIILFAAIIIFFMTGWTLLRDKQRILRDNGTAVKKAPYSLSRTQMAFWTVIILISILWIWRTTGEFVEITTQVLILLGISAGTTITATIIDKSDLENPKIKKRLQDTEQEDDDKGFFQNIVSDQNGLSIHRFQNVVFSLAIGLYFLYEVFKNHQIPTLNEELMVMMGISSGTYLAIKKGENSAAQADKDAEPEVKKAQEEEAKKKVAETVIQNEEEDTSAQQNSDFS